MVFAGCAHDQTTRPEAAKPAVDSYRPNESQSKPGSHFTRARELYALGPSKANEIIVELDLELAEHPDNLDALVLKATTQMGIDQLDAALATLERHDEIASKTGTISPSAIMLRARCLYYKGDYQTAKRKGVFPAR